MSPCERIIIEHLHLFTMKTNSMSHPSFLSCLFLQRASLADKDLVKEQPGVSLDPDESNTTTTSRPRNGGLVASPITCHLDQDQQEPEHQQKGPNETVEQQRPRTGLLDRGEYINKMDNVSPTEPIRLNDVSRRTDDEERLNDKNNNNKCSGKVSSHSAISNGTNGCSRPRSPASCSPPLSNHPNNGHGTMEGDGKELEMVASHRKLSVSPLKAVATVTAGGNTGPSLAAMTANVVAVPEADNVLPSRNATMSADQLLRLAAAPKVTSSLAINAELINNIRSSRNLLVNSHYFANLSAPMTTTDNDDDDMAKNKEVSAK